MAFKRLISILIMTGLLASGCVVPKPKVRTEKQVYKPGEAIVVKYSDFQKTGKSQSWIVTLVPSETPVTKFGQSFTLTDMISGNLTFDGVPAGKYSIRVYLRSLGSGDNIVSYCEFEVLE